jgi:hypothetical protein
MRANHHAVIVAVTLVATSLWLSPARASDLTVTALTGAVSLIEHGHAVRPAIGAKLSLPVEIHTGADGVVDLQQLGSSLHVGPNSTIAVPEADSHGNAIDKIKQSAGYVLYNIKSRKDHPLAVETPYLVSVVKGTVFTIAVKERATTVALMEGLLDISAPGIAEHVLLKPNQSIRHADGEPRFSVNSAESAHMMPRNDLRANAPQLLPEAAPSGQMAQVAKDLADAGAAVAAGHAIATRQAGQQSGTNGSGTNSTAGGSGSTGTPASTGSQSTSTGGSVDSTAAGSGGALGSQAIGSSNAGGASSGSGSVTSAGSVTLPSSGSGSSTGTTGNCNGKNNGTGTGNCYGHQSGRASKQ